MVRNKKTGRVLKLGLCSMMLMGVAGFMNPVLTEAAPQNYYNVTDAQFGVNASDTVADSKGIQDALNKAKGSQSEVTVYFPQGDYYVDKTLLVYSNTHIILDQNAVIHRMDNIIDNGLIHNADQNGKMDQVGGYDMSENITIEGGTWDGGNISLATSASDLIRIDHAKNIVIKDSVIQNVYDCHLIELIGVENGTISGCTIKGFRYKSGKEKDYTYAREVIALDAAWTNNESDLNDRSSQWAHGSVVDGTACRHVTVTNNTFIDIPCGVGQHHYVDSGKGRNAEIEISNNTFTCSSSMKYCKTAITCSGTDGLNVQGNTVTGPYRFAIHVIVSNGVSITNNDVKNITINGIMVDVGTITSISGNKLSNITKHGISIGDGTVDSVDNNTLTNVKHNGICVYGGNVAEINNNTISNIGKHGISISGATKGKAKGGTIKTITGNKITKAKENGICIDLGKITTVKKNTIKNSGKHGISLVGGSVGTGKSKSNGIMSNTITTCKQNGISVSGNAKVSSITGNKISSVKNNGISLTQKAKVYFITKNSLKKCSKHGIWNGLSGVKVTIKDNSGSIK